MAATTIELRGFLGLHELFRRRQWPTPVHFPLAGEITGPELLELLELSNEPIEAIFVNRVAHSVEQAVIRPGDRVALVPPGVPGPHRVLLGLKQLQKP